VISVAIPVSVAATFAPMNLSGLSLNIMSLGGLALGIGMLVDSGIVVVESIARCREEGDAHGPAVVRGTSEVGGAVIASTLTTVAVFFPMVFVEGVAGQVFADLALTVVYALLASLLVAVFVVPALAGKIGHAGDAGPVERLELRQRIARVLRYRSLGPLSSPSARGFTRRFATLLTFWPVLAVVVLLLSRAGGPRIAIPGVSLLALIAMAAMAVNFVLRARHGVTGFLAALFLLPVDAVLLVLEGAWILVLWTILVLGGPIAMLAWATGFLVRWLLAPLGRGLDAALRYLGRVYPAVIRSALRNRAPVLAGAALCMALMVLGFLSLDSALIPEVHQGEFDMEFTLPVGTPLEETLRTVAPIEAYALEHPGIDRAILKVGADPEADSDPEEGEHTARLTAHVAPDRRSPGPISAIAGLARKIVTGFARASEGGVAAVREERVVEDLRSAIEGMSDLQAKVARPVLFSFRTPIEVEVEAFDLGQLRLLGDRVRREMSSISGLTDVESTARPGSPEIQIVYDREALVRLGLDLRDVADIVRTKVLGSSATEYRKRERRIDVVVRLAEGDRATVRQLRNLVVNPGATIPVPLSAVAEVDIAAGPADIRRVGQRRVSLVTANVSGRGLARVSAEIGERLSALTWPEGAGWRLSGQVREMERSTRSLWVALGISIFLVYVVMASQFESLLHPLLIMITVPLALFGAVAALFVLGIPLSVVVFLGMIMLAGIVVNNAIVLVDYVNTLRARGQSMEDALVEAGRVRLRPILMTTSTTVLALLPMAMGLGDGAEIRTPMALTVIAGLVTSTVLTLVVLPTLYAAAETALSGFRGGRAREDEAVPEQAGR
jgi:HAE1 family hydrophobic/amphiphilic exporter-1